MKGLDFWRDASESTAWVATGFLLLRVGFGALILVIHGAHKLLEGFAHFTNGTPWPLVTEIADLGTPAPLAIAIIVSLIQIACALGLILGWHSRLNAVCLVVPFVGAVFQNVSADRDPQLALLYLLVATAFVFLGGGRYSMDARS